MSAPPKPEPARRAYPWIPDPIEGRFVQRINRFACQVEVQGVRTLAHLPNSGRLEEILQPGVPVLLQAKSGRRKTGYDLLLSQVPHYPTGEPIWAGVDSRLPSRLVGWLAEQGALEPFGRPSAMTYEPAHPGGRLDLRVESETGIHLVETKSVNLIDCQGLARFPDAPTPRGGRHLRELARLARGPQRAWLVFVILRQDARAFSPFSERDPAFSGALGAALEAGVGVMALRFRAGATIEWLGQVPLIWPPPPFAGLWPPDCPPEAR
jgi:sugar fermentation stimulation protein A